MSVVKIGKTQAGRTTNLALLEPDTIIEMPQVRRFHTIYIDNVASYSADQLTSMQRAQLCEHRMRRNFK